MAHVDVRPSTNGDATAARSQCTDPEWTAMLGRALARIEQTVRSDDRVCPYGVSRIAIAFGPGARAVSPRVLGERLARAVGQGLGHLRALPSAPVRGGGDPSVVQTGPTSSTAPVGSSRPRNGTIPSTTLITVDRSVGTGALAGDRFPPSPPARVAWSGSVPRWRHRTVIRSSTHRAIGYGSRRDDLAQHPDRHPSVGAVLVVDPDPVSAGSPGLATLAACSSAERLGFKAEVVSLTDDVHLVTDIDGVSLDLVVLMVGAEPARAHPSWSSSTWCVSARLAAAYRSAGTEVLAVSAGAGAGALAGCLERGALVLFDLNALPGQLVDLRRTGRVATDRTITRHTTGLPASLQALLDLTSSERRVLYYLTTGRSAQEIADETTVSLATVRSHIRSVLRKLGVRSQLAAVALANRRGLVPVEAVPTG